VGSRQDEFSQDRLTPERLSAAVAFACENPIVRFAVMLLFFPFQKGFDQKRMSRNWLFATIRFCKDRQRRRLSTALRESTYRRS
jgi:hypothetical protein